MIPEKRSAIKLYDRYCQQYEQRTKDYGRFIEPDYELFSELVPGKRIIDLGAGPGRDAAALAARGLEPICIDISSGMLELAHKKSLRCCRMDFENLGIKDGSVDGAWSYTSLTKLPKVIATRVVEECWRVLRPGGILFIALIEGTSEGWKPPDQKYAIARFQACYNREELRALGLRAGFELVAERSIPKDINGRNNYIHALFRK